MDGDTIAVAAGTYNVALGETFPLTIDKDLMITAVGPGSTTIDATGTKATVIVVNFGKTVMISGVTVTGGGNGGIHNEGTLTLTNSTVSGNTARCAGEGCDAVGGGIHNRGTFTPANTIVAKNPSGGDCSNLGTITSNGFNLDSDNSCNLNMGLGDLPGVDPLLGSLQNNGGPTETHALLPGSPAIDAVTSGCPPPATDQRGVSRPQGIHCDIGAYERVP